MSTRRSSGIGSSGRKRRLSTPRQANLDADTQPQETATKKSKASTKSEDGFEFTSKKKKGATAAAASSSASSSAAASSSSSSSSAPAAAPAASSSSSTSSSSVPHISAPQYPAPSKSQSFTFTPPAVFSPAALAASVTTLCSSVLQHELSLVTATFGPKSKHKSASKGQLQYIVSACETMSTEITSQMSRTLEEYLKTTSDESDKPMVLENERNVERREKIENYARLTKQAEADRLVFSKERMRLEEQAKKLSSSSSSSSSSSQQSSIPIVTGVLSEADIQLLSEHKGGDLRADIQSAYTRASVKGDASLHTLERISDYLKVVQTDQKIMAKRINAEEKKAYGSMVDDPRDLISLITSSSSASGAPAADTNSMDSSS